MNIEMRKYIECTYEEKKPLLKVVEQMIELAIIARKEGVLALEEQIEKLDDRLLKIGLGLVVDGTDPDIVKNIMETTIVTSFKTGAELLSQLIITEGLLSLQAGENPRLMEEKLLAFLGGEFTIQDIMPLDNIEEEYKRLMSDPDLWTQEKGLPEFENLLNRSNNEIGIILREVDSKDLSIALRGASTELKNRFLSNLTKHICVQILNDMKYMGPLPNEIIPTVQQKILDIVKRLQGAGELQ